MADLDVRPIAQVKGAIGAHALRDRDERGVIAAEEVVAVVADETATCGLDLIGDQTMPV